MTESEPWTIGRLLTWTIEYLRRHGADSPRLDAEVLLAHARGCERIELYTAYDEVVDDRVRGVFRELVKRRGQGEPVAYLVGHREFYSLSFFVNRDVLIPRPETEFVVLALLDSMKQHAGSDTIEVADVGAGSGVIGICAAKHEPRCRVTAVDVSPAALAVARRNAQELGVGDRIDFIESDLFAALPDEQTFDFIASNPPYVTEGELQEMPTVVSNHEPHVALVAGPNGLEVIERLIAEAGPRLHPGGWLIFEISPMIDQGACELIRRDGRFLEPSIIKDLAGLARVVMAQRSSEQ